MPEQARFWRGVALIASGFALLATVSAGVLYAELGQEAAVRKQRFDAAVFEGMQRGTECAHLITDDACARCGSFISLCRRNAH